MLIETLRIARASGTPVRVIYSAGSQPGSQRAIVPVVIADKEVRAIDVATGTEKVFKIEFLSIPPAHCNAPAYDPAFGKAESQLDSLTIGQISKSIIDEMQSLGWHVEAAEDEIALFSHFKNGKPRKTPEVYLSYVQFTVDFTIDMDGEMREERRESKRPYRLGSKSFASARTFSNLSAAWPKFLEEAQSRAPRLPA